MGDRAKKTFGADFRRFFLRGLATLLPTVLTIVVLVKSFEFVQQHISVHITNGVIWLVVQATDDYPGTDADDVTKYIAELEAGGTALTIDLTDEDVKQYRHEYYVPVGSFDPVNNDNDRRRVQLWKLRQPGHHGPVRMWKLRGQWNRGPMSIVGFLLAIVLVYMLGRLLASFVGRKTWQLFEHSVQRIPGFKQVYPYIKQVTDFLFGENKIEFSRVVAVQYPRKGLWSLGMVTGAGLRKISDDNQEYLTVFIPSSPTPVTGYIIHVKKQEVVDLPISMEEAFRFTVSGGVIVPDHQALPTQRIELKLERPNIDKQDDRKENSL